MDPDTSGYRRVMPSFNPVQILSFLMGRLVAWTGNGIEHGDQEIYSILSFVRNLVRHVFHQSVHFLAKL